MLRAARTPQECNTTAKHLGCQVCVDVFGILGAAGKTTLDLESWSHARSGIDCTGIRVPWFSIFAGVSASLCTWLDPLGRLAKTCSVTERHMTEACSATIFPREVWRTDVLVAPKQIGGVERRCDMFEQMMTKIIKRTPATGRETVDVILSDCLSFASDMSRHSGFALVVHAPEPRWATKRNVFMLVLCEHMLTDRLFSEQSKHGAKARRRHSPVLQKSTNK